MIIVHLVFEILKLNDGTFTFLHAILLEVKAIEFSNWEFF